MTPTKTKNVDPVGRTEMKLLILSDIHGNWPALQSIVNAEFDADQILCLGDLVDYGPEPAACVAWAMQERSKARFIQGNHDWGVALRKDPRSSPPFRRLTVSTQAFSIQALTPAMLQFLRELKPMDSFEMLGKRCVACHAAPSDPLFRYLRTTQKDLENEISVAGTPDYLFFGHTHWPLLQRIGRTTIVNPGSVGQPKDGDIRAPYAVCEDGKLELRRVAYPIEATVRAYARTPLASSDVESLIAVLRTGGTLPPAAVAQ
jgi:putative phosphoesterase